MRCHIPLRISSGSIDAHPPSTVSIAQAFAIAALISLVPAVHAQTLRTLYYVGPDNGLWSDAANWSTSPDGPGGDGPPTSNLSESGDDALIQPSSSRTVSLQSDAAARSISVIAPVAGTTVTLRQSAGHLSMWGLRISAPQGATASFIQTGGAAYSSDSGSFSISADAGGTATATLAGTGVRAGDVDIGGQGSVTVYQSAGSVVGSSNVALASDAGSTATYFLSGGYLGGDALTIGRLGVATLRQSGGQTFGYYGISVGPGSAYDMTGGSIDQSNAASNGISVAGALSVAGSAAITAERLYVGPAGSFTQSGGAVSIIYASLKGDVLLAGGATLFGSLANDGTFRYAGGDLTAYYVSGVGSFDMSAGFLSTREFRQSALSATGSASIRIAPYQSRSSLVSSLTLDDSAQLDITTNTFLIDYSSPSPRRQVLQYIRDGLLLSSFADPLHSLACIESADVPDDRRTALAGEPVDTTTLIVLLALLGDANLDGAVDDADYALLLAGRSMPQPTWSHGDFNLDSLIDDRDYFLIDRTLALTTGLPPSLIDSRRAEFGDAYVSALLASLPEPHGALLSILPAFCSTRSFRRRLER